MSTELLDATSLEEDCFTSSLLLDFGFTLAEESSTFELEDCAFALDVGVTEEEEYVTEPDEVTEQLDAFDFSTEEEDFSSSVRETLEEEPIESTEPLLWIALSHPPDASSQ